jgi:predicted DNA-binding transcriptional regulator AlpA
MDQNEPIPQFMTLEEVAKILKISRSTVNRYIIQHDNPLPVIYLSDKTPRVLWDQFELWIKSLEGGGKNE